MPNALKVHRPNESRMKRHRPSENRPSSCKMGYGRDWRLCRLMYLRANPLCATCLAKGFTTVATEVDHIVPLKRGGERLDVANLQSLCKPCHSRKTGRERGT